MLCKRTFDDYIVCGNGNCSILHIQVDVRLSRVPALEIVAVQDGFIFHRYSLTVLAGLFTRHLRRTRRDCTFILIRHRVLVPVVVQPQH